MKISLQSWRQARREAVPKSRDAGIVTTLALMACGFADNRNALAPLNAVSHIAWGEEATAQRGFSLKYTLVGALLSTGSVGGWAALHQLLCGAAEDESKWAWPVAGAVLVSALAWFVDYKIVPRRLQPGFESRVSRRSMWLIYAALAAALSFSAPLRRK